MVRLKTPEDLLLFYDLIGKVLLVVGEQLISRQTRKYRTG